MFRKTMIAVAAAATMALSIGATTSTAEAGVKIYLGAPSFVVGGHEGYYQEAGYYNHQHCKWKRVWYNGYWKRVKVCFNHRHYQNNGY